MKQTEITNIVKCLYFQMIYAWKYETLNLDTKRLTIDI